mgnify:CR=1 FL=1
MLVAPSGVGISLTERRLQHWGGQVCTVSDVAVAEALLPERAWHAVMVDHGFGAAAIERFGQRALSHAAHRIVMFTPSTRQELQPATGSTFTGYLVKPLRAASLAARLAAPPEVAAPDIAAEAPDEIAEQQAAPAPSGLSLSILVAEDNEINALLMRSLLGRLGHRAVITTNGEQALEFLEDPSVQVDIFVTDVIMPGIDGPGWVTQALDRRPQTPVVFVSGYTEDTLSAALTRIPRAVFLGKPFSLGDLTETIARQIAS